MSIKETNGNDPTKTLTNLANEAKIQIHINKYILEVIDIYQNQINQIKALLLENKNENIKNIKNNGGSKNIQFIDEYINRLKSLKNKNELEIQNFNEKIKDYKSKLFEYDSIIKPLEKEKLDNFILKNTLLKLNYEFKRYNTLINIAKSHSIFPEEKRDRSIDKKNGDYFIYDLSLDIQRDMLMENRDYNKCINKIKSYQKRIKNKNKKIEKYKYYINKMKKGINKIGLLKKFDSSTNIFSEMESANLFSEIKNKENIFDKNTKTFLEDENIENNDKKIIK